MTCRFITFTFVLFGSYLLTDNWDFGSGEFRKAITISILTFFLATLAFANQIEIAQNTVLGQVFNNFWTIISTVVAFYFAARVVENNNLSNNARIVKYLLEYFYRIKSGIQKKSN